MGYGASGPYYQPIYIRIYARILVLPYEPYALFLVKFEWRGAGNHLFDFLLLISEFPISLFTGPYPLWPCMA